MVDVGTGNVHAEGCGMNGQSVLDHRAGDEPEKVDYRVLAVDDSRINCAMIAKILVKAGYRVETAMSGAEARKKALDWKPHLILLDIEMPDEDGFVTISKLKEVPETAGIPVIFLSGVTDVQSKVQGFNLGAVDFITKPFEPEEIKARTKLHIKLSLATQALIEQQRQKLKQLGDAQHQMLVQPEDLPEAKFSVIYRPLNEAGGDFYSVVRISEHVYGYFVGDVSGHDLSTSYITAAINVLLKQNCSPLYTPSESMRQINTILRQTLDQRKFLAATYLQIDRQNHLATLINMGNPPLLCLPVDGEPFIRTVRGAPLGMFAQSFYDSFQFEVNDGDRFFLYSDGILETEGKVWAAEMWRLIFAGDAMRQASLTVALDRLIGYFVKDNSVVKDDVVVLGTEV